MKFKSEREIEELIQLYNKNNEIADLLNNEFSLNSCYILKKQTEITIFNDLHVHDLYELLYVVEGKLTYQIEGIHYELNAGDIILISPTMLHKLDNIQSKNSTRIIINFSENYAKKLSTENCDLLKAFEITLQRKIHKISFDISHRKTIQKYFDIMLELQFSKEYGDDLAFNLRFCQAMLMINKEVLNSRDENENVFTTNKVVSETIEYINENYSKPILISDIANRLSLSESRLSHLFKQETGISIHKFLIKKRLMYAKNFIRNGEHINVVYALVGFNDNTSFFRAFKKEFNTTPKKYLANYKMTTE